MVRPTVPQPGPPAPGGSPSHPAPPTRRRLPSGGDFTTEDARRGFIGCFNALMEGADPWTMEVARRNVNNAVQSKALDVRVNNGTPLVLVNGNASGEAANGNPGAARKP